jgi:CheY-like chemotaxis protein
MGDKKYCICCGEEVPYYVVERDQKREYACSYCGFTLEVLKLWEEEDTQKPAQKQKQEEMIETSEEPVRTVTSPPEKGETPKKEEGSEVSANVTSTTLNEAVIKEEGEKASNKEKEIKIEDSQGIEPVEIRSSPLSRNLNTKAEGSITDSSGVQSHEERVDALLVERDSIKLRIPEKPERDKNILREEKTKADTYAIVAEDSEFLRTLLKELIIKKSLSDNVIAVSNGIELVAEYTRLINERARINFAIIDLNMPEMDGLTAVRTMRVLEDRSNIKRVPVVFFSAIKADEALRKQMSILEPAHYINKGVSPSPQILAERVEVLLHFLTYRYARP